MIVTKFGGSSMADADQFKKVRNILYQDPNRRMVVVSAAGKGVSDSVKLTDQLINIYERVQKGLDYSAPLNAVWQRVEAIVTALDLSLPIHDELADISRQIHSMSYAELVSRGEYLTARLLADYLDWPMIDAADFLVLNNGKVDLAASQQRLLAQCKNVDHCVIPGFYGTDKHGNIQLLPRGGGDTSGAVVANLMNAKSYENWTDTNGLLAVDPRIVDNPDKVSVLSYDELQELSYLGVKVFNEEAIQPVRLKQIPIRIMNTNQPELAGTMVVTNKDDLESDIQIAGIAGKQDQVILTVKQYQLANNVDAVIKLIKLVNDFHLKSSYSLAGDSICFVLSGVEDQNDLRELVGQINNQVHPDDVQVKAQVAKVAVVSETFREQPRMVGKMIDLLEYNQIAVQQVIQTSNDIKVVFGVANQNYQKTIKCLYHQFFRDAQIQYKLAVNQ